MRKNKGADQKLSKAQLEQQGCQLLPMQKPADEPLSAGSLEKANESEEDLHRRRALKARARAEAFAKSEAAGERALDLLDRATHVNQLAMAMVEAADRVDEGGVEAEQPERYRELAKCVGDIVRSSGELPGMAEAVAKEYRPSIAVVQRFLEAATHAASNTEDQAAYEAYGAAGHELIDLLHDAGFRRAEAVIQVGQGPARAMRPATAVRVLTKAELDELEEKNKANLAKSKKLYEMTKAVIAKKAARRDERMRKAAHAASVQSAFEHVMPKGGSFIA